MRPVGRFPWRKSVPYKPQAIPYLQYATAGRALSNSFVERCAIPPSPSPASKAAAKAAEPIASRPAAGAHTARPRASPPPAPAPGGRDPFSPDRFGASAERELCPRTPTYIIAHTGNHLIYRGCIRSGGRRPTQHAGRLARSPLPQPPGGRNRVMQGSERPARPQTPGPPGQNPEPGSSGGRQASPAPWLQKAGPRSPAVRPACPAVTRPAPRTHPHGSVAQRGATAATGLVSGDDWAGRLEVAVSPSAGPWPADAAVNAPQARAHPRRGPPIPDGGIVGPGSALVAGTEPIAEHYTACC